MTVSATFINNTAFPFEYAVSGLITQGPKCSQRRQADSL